MYLGAKRRYINTLPFLSFPFLYYVTVILKDDGTDNRTAWSVIRPMGRGHARLIMAGAVPSTVPSCLQRNEQPSQH